MKHKDLYPYSALMLVLISILFLTGCPKKPLPIAPELEPIVTGESHISDEEFQSLPEFMTINFDFDKFNFTEEACKKLQGSTNYP